MISAWLVWGLLCQLYSYFCTPVYLPLPFKKTLILKRVTETIQLDSALIHTVWFSGFDTG